MSRFLHRPVPTYALFCDFLTRKLWLKPGLRLPAIGYGLAILEKSDPEASQQGRAIGRAFDVARPHEWAPQ